MLNEHLVATARTEVVRPCAAVAGTQKWCRPPDGLTKINSDAAVSEASGCCAGFVARDSRGELVLGGAKALQLTKVVELAEAEAMLWAMRCCMDRGITAAIFETDCLSLVNKLKAGDLVGGALGNVITCLRDLASSFQMCLWSHVRRQANSVAHFLASTRPCLDFLSSSLVSFPSTCETLLFRDLIDE